jgi:hypothetical protein
MSQSSHWNWLRIGLAVFAAELVPILLLVLIVVIYGFARQVDSPTPEEFAPMAGNWVGPIGGFLATLLAARWVGRRAAHAKFVHGIAVGVGTATLDLILAALLSGGIADSPLLIFSNGGRILAGILGGILASRQDT